MTNSYPTPYWEGQIGIPFTREEWKVILSCVQFVLYEGPSYPDEYDMERNIIDRIEKDLGIE